MHPKLPRFASACLLISLVGSVASRADDTRALYFHPVITLVSATDGKWPFQVPLTFEIEEGGGRSLVFDADLIDGSYANDEVHGVKPPNTSIQGVNLTASLRNYFNGKRIEGFYYAPGLGFGFHEEHRKEETRGGIHFLEGQASGFVFGAIGYLGYSAKWSHFNLYCDLGLGYQYISVSGENAQTIGFSKSGVTGDANVGVGIPF